MLRFFTVYGPYGRPDMAIFSFTHDQAPAFLFLFPLIFVSYENVIIERGCENKTEKVVKELRKFYMSCMLFYWLELF